MAPRIATGKRASMAARADIGSATSARLTAKFARPVTTRTRQHFRPVNPRPDRTGCIRSPAHLRKGFLKMSDTNKPCVCPLDNGTSRRSFLRTSAVLASGIAAMAASLAPLRELTDYTSVEQFMQKHYKEMTAEEMRKVLDRITREVEQQYKIRPHVKDFKPMDGVE